MKLIYISAKNFPGTTANHVHVRELSRVLAKQCDYTLVIGSGTAADLVGIPLVNRQLTKAHGRTIDYFFWFRRFAQTFGGIGLGPDAVILSNDAQLLLIALFWRFVLRRKYKIVSYWHMFFKPWQNGLIARGSDAALSLTTELEKRLEQQYPNLRGKILVTPDAVNADVFDISLSKEEARRKCTLPLTPKILLYTGRFKTLGMDKGITDIMKAMAIGLKERSAEFNNMLFVAVGGRTEDVAEYTQLAKDLGIATNVRLTGFVSQSELAIYQKAADILMLYFPRNEHYSYYMSPMKLFEYMIAERPIIASDLPSIREILSEQEAFIVPPGDPEMLANIISDALSTPPESQKRAMAAYEQGREYTWEEKAKKIVQFVSSL